MTSRAHTHYFAVPACLVSLCLRRCCCSLQPATRERVVGAHFFSPAHVMPLLEIVRTRHTSKQVRRCCSTKCNMCVTCYIISFGCAAAVAAGGYVRAPHEQALLRQLQGASFLLVCPLLLVDVGSSFDLFCCAGRIGFWRVLEVVCVPFV
eukprot:GHRQ01024971.1.p2 GENE.GHRQ01024971.1~~GHRQ01024971.1.p2  ORF type:complete len:150 (-),score=7.98 GHRQ01024971.1:152-601(-)